MSVVKEREHVPETVDQVEFWLIQRGFYRDVAEADRIDINAFLLQPGLIAGLSPIFYTDETIANVASVVEAYHDGQKRKATPSHPYMKHVYMTAFQCGRLLPGGDLEQPFAEYVAPYGFTEAPDIVMAGAGLAHDVLESNKTRSKSQFYHDLLASGVPRYVAEQVAEISQYMIPGEKAPHLPPEEYMLCKEADVIRYFNFDTVQRLGLQGAAVSHLVKAADIVSNALETIDDIQKKREGKNLGDERVFNASLQVRLEVFRRRLAILMHYDPRNPFIPDLQALCQAGSFDHTASVDGIEN